MLQLSTTRRGTNDLEGTLTSQAKIIQGRFHLRICREFTPGKHCCPSPESLTGPILGPCPHLDFQPEMGRLHNGHLHRDIRAIYESFNHSHPTSRSFSCNHCPTDIQLEVGIVYARFTFWYDLGTGLYPYEPAWVSHTNFLGNWCTPIEFDYTHGTIRDAYEKSN